MWKHHHLRKHRWFMTGVEIFLPILIAYLLCAEGGQYLGHNSTHYNATIDSVYNEDYLTKRTAYQGLVFAPTNEFTIKIVDKAIQSLCLSLIYIHFYMLNCHVFMLKYNNIFIFQTSKLPGPAQMKQNSKTSSLPIRISLKKKYGWEWCSRIPVILVKYRQN